MFRHTARMMLATYNVHGRRRSACNELDAQTLDKANKHHRPSSCEMSLASADRRSGAPCSKIQAPTPNTYQNGRSTSGFRVVWLRLKVLPRLFDIHTSKPALACTGNQTQHGELLGEDTRVLPSGNDFNARVLQCPACTASQLLSILSC